MIIPQLSNNVIEKIYPRKNEFVRPPIANIDQFIIVLAVANPKPDLMLVCLGAPKQEMWMQANSHRLDVGIMIGAGGSLDVFAGVVERAPEAWQKMGMEWLYRAIKQPQRLKRVAKLPLFLCSAVGARIKGK